MNALFIPDALRPEVTWFGSIGMVINNVFKKSNSTKLRFVADQKMVYIGDGVKLNAESVEKLTFSRGKFTISETKGGKEKSRPEVQVNLEDLGMDFVVRFTKNHLDMVWNNIAQQPKDSHGIIGIPTSSTPITRLLSRPIPSFSVFQCATLKSWEWAWPRGQGYSKASLCDYYNISLFCPIV